MGESIRSVTLRELAERVGGSVEGDPNTLITSVTGLDDARAGSLVRVENERYAQAAEASAAAAVLAAPGPVRFSKPCIRVAHVRMAFARCLEVFSPDERPHAGVHRTAVVGDGSEIAADASIGPYAVLGRRVRVGARVVVHPHAVIGDDVEIGADSVVHPHSVLYRGTILGSRVRIHAGAAIGADGYGYEWSGSGHYKIPQIGRVRLGDDVEVGANTTIDRATTGETVIGSGTKIDNLVQIGHNVRTGQHCLIVAQVGIAGSSTLGNGVVLAGQVGVKDHVQLGDGVQVAAKGGVWGDVPAGQKISGNPPRPHREEVRIQAALGRLPDLLRRVAALERLLGRRDDRGD